MSRRSYPIKIPMAFPQDGLDVMNGVVSSGSLVFDSIDWEIHRMRGGRSSHIAYWKKKNHCVAYIGDLTAHQLAELTLKFGALEYVNYDRSWKILRGELPRED